MSTLMHYRLSLWLLGLGLWWYHAESRVLRPFTEHSLQIDTKSAPDLPKPDIYFLHINSLIKYRYVRTKVSSKVVNPANASQEVHFTMLLPDTAFITSFYMEINHKKFKAYVKEKDYAKKVYDDAVKGGLSAAHVDLSARDSNKFTISVNVAANEKVNFVLSYEELLSRTLGLYSHVVHINPGQVVNDLAVNVHIKETNKIIKLHIPEFRSTNEITPGSEEKENSMAEVRNINEKEVSIKFSPTVEQQILLASTEEEKRNGIGGQFIVQYDVDRESEGHVLVNEGYFVYFFSPQGLDPLRKLTVFVLDVSGSMEGRKLEQVKEAMSKILDDLGPSDYFNLIEFSYSVTVHNLESATKSVVLAPDTSLELDKQWTSASGIRSTPQAYPATEYYKSKAKQVIKKMSSGGGTNINDALKNSLLVAKLGLKSLHKMESNDSGNAIEPIIIFLTDGDPTVGITNPNKILSMVSELNNQSRVAIFSLGFGDGADLHFLRKLSLANAGFARNIYEASDAAIQLNNFYKEIASPLLSNVTFRYPPEQVREMTRSNFHSLFSGSELVVSGKVSNQPQFNLSVTATTANGSMIFNAQGIRDIPDNVMDIEFIDEEPININEKLDEKRKIRKTIGTMERLWAHLSLKQLLDQYDLKYENSGEISNDTIKEKALELALKYKFVTSLTSLVVVQPNKTVEIDSDSQKKQTSPEHVLFESPMISHGEKIFLERIDIVAEDLDTEGDQTFDELKWLSSNKSIWIPNDKNVTKEYLVSFNSTNKQYQECFNNETHCRHLVKCILPNFTNNFEDYVPYYCPIEERFAGVCCPDNFSSDTPSVFQETTTPFTEFSTIFDSN